VKVQGHIWKPRARHLIGWPNVGCSWQTTRIINWESVTASYGPLRCC